MLPATPRQTPDVTRGIYVSDPAAVLYELPRQSAVADRRCSISYISFVAALRAGPSGMTTAGGVSEVRGASSWARCQDCACGCCPLFSHSLSSAGVTQKAVGEWVQLDTVRTL